MSLSFSTAGQQDRTTTDSLSSNRVDVGQKYSPVKARFLTAIFVFFDVLSFIVQGAGGSLYSSDNIKLYPIAKTVLIIGSSFS